MADFDISILNGNDFVVTQNYGDNPDYYYNLTNPKGLLPYHIGTDIVSQTGSDWNIESFLGGQVLYTGWRNGGYGNVIIILQDDNILVKYMHLDSVFICQGQRVEQLQEIGLIGDTGNSTARHLHFECTVWDGNMWSISQHFDGIPYLNDLDDEFKAKSKPTQDQTPVEIPSQTPVQNIDDMPKKDLIDVIVNKFVEPETTNLRNAVNNDDWNYLLAYSGAERIKEVAKLNIDLMTKNGIYNALLIERNNLFDENADLKKNLQDGQAKIVSQENQLQLQLERLQVKAIEKPLESQQNPILVQEKTDELITLGHQLDEAQNPVKKPFIKANKGRIFTLSGILGYLGLGYLEPIIDQIRELRFVTSYQFKLSHLIIASLITIGVYIMFRNKINTEIQKVLDFTTID